MRSLLKLNSKKIWNPETRVEESLYYNNGEPIVYSPAKEFTRENHPSAVELFSGAGGLSTGLTDAGFQAVAGVDIHKPLIKTFSHNHRNAYAINADIKSLDPYVLSDLTGVSQPDLLAAGVPCQGFSLNNRKRYARDLAIWSINKAKWQAAEQYANKQGWRFIVVTEKDLSAYK